jgi:molybdopterin molybdotransferase
VTATPLISVGEARRRVLDAVRPLPAETVAIDDALGRVLAQDVTVVADVPSFPSSAMDGYAVLAGESGQTLTVIGEARAGTPTARAVGAGEAIRVSTGAAVPEGATAVIAQEQVSAENGETIVTRAAVRVDENIRRPGEDMLAGTVVLAAGTRLGALELGAVVAAGAGAVPVARRPRVTVLCTGDELRAPGEPLGPGEIHNSNAPMLTGLAIDAGASADPAGRLPDDREATVAGIAAALQSADVVIISGGVSVGPHDHVKPALASLGVDEVFWSVSLRPGKPTWFGVAPGGALVFGLPGNPVSAVVTFSLFVAPALAALQRAAAPAPPWPDAVLGTEVPRNASRDEAVRVRLQLQRGDIVAYPTRSEQGSHILSSLLGADALALIPAGNGALAAGARVALEALAG